MVHNCPVVSRGRTSLYPTVVKVITVMYTASAKLRPSNTMYPNTPRTVIIPSAKRALSMRRVATRGSYTFLSEMPLLLDLLRSSSAIWCRIIESPSAPQTDLIMKPRIMTLGPCSSCPYSPECVEGEFYEVHIQDLA